MVITDQIALGQALAKAMLACIEDSGEPDANGKVDCSEVEMTFEFKGIAWKVTVVPTGGATDEVEG